MSSRFGRGGRDRQGAGGAALRLGRRGGNGFSLTRDWRYRPRGRGGWGEVAVRSLRPLSAWKTIHLMQERAPRRSAFPEG